MGVALSALSGCVRSMDFEKCLGWWGRGALTVVAPVPAVGHFVFRAASNRVLQLSVLADSPLATVTEVASDCVNDLIGACIRLHVDPERPSKLACLRKVHVCATPLGRLEQFARPLEIFSRLVLELTQDPVENFSEAFSEMTRGTRRQDCRAVAVSGLAGLASPSTGRKRFHLLGWP
jgi:hypothetical protein